MLVMWWAMKPPLEVGHEELVHRVYIPVIQGIVQLYDKLFVAVLFTDNGVSFGLNFLVSQL